MRATETSHFYLGRVTNLDRFSNFLEEHYDEDEDDGENDDRPLSEFYGSQNKLFCDHDFMETGTRNPGESLEEFFAPYSYADQWSKALCEAARAANLEDANILIFISKEEIESPRSVKEDGFELAYIGLFEYAI